MKFEIGNIVKTPCGTIYELTKFHFSTSSEVGTVVSFNCGHRCSGVMKLDGQFDSKSCSCWYDSWERCFHEQFPDEECEDCKGLGEIQIYRFGLNDCEFIANTRREYDIIKITKKIKKLQEKLKNLELGL